MNKEKIIKDTLKLLIEGVIQTDIAVKTLFDLTKFEKPVCKKCGCIDFVIQETMWCLDCGTDHKSYLITIK